MSGLAEILLSRGKRVSGSDLRSNTLTDRLRARGAVITCGHCPENISGDTQLIVRSSCIREDNPEMIEAAGKGIPVVRRGELLGQLMNSAEVPVAVTGTHGKTTTSAIIAHVTESAGASPTSVIGGTIDILGSNARNGGGSVFVAEVDESDGYFRNISSRIAVITNVEREHMENYGSMDNLLAAYSEFIDRICPEGVLIYNGEDPVLEHLSRGARVKTLSFGMDPDGRYDISCRLRTCARSIEMEVYEGLSREGVLKSPLIGRHNAMNILAAFAACSRAGFSFKDIVDGVSSFKGAGRRFEKIGAARGVEVIEDYAHHPTELSAVIKAAREYSGGRVLSVFQPHRYSRTRDLAELFVECFNGTDVLILTDVYSAHEDRAEGAGIKDIYSRIDRSRFEHVDLLSKEEVPEKISRLAREGDTVLVLGAGDIREVSPLILQSVARGAGRGQVTRG